MTYTQLDQLRDGIKDAVHDIENIYDDALLHKTPDGRYPNLKDKVPEKYVKELEDAFYALEQVLVINRDGEK